MWRRHSREWYRHQGPGQGRRARRTVQRLGPQGLGFLQAGNGPQTMSVEDAQAAIDRQGLYFDYLFGRPLKVNLIDDTFDPFGFDRDNGGEGTAQKIIDRLKEMNEVNSDATKADHAALFTEKAQAAAEYALPAEFMDIAVQGLTEMAQLEEDGIPVPPEGLTPREHLDWASDQALRLYDRGETSKSLLLFGMLLSKNPDNAWILTNPMTPVLLKMGVDGGRSQLEYMMKGFAASDTVPA